MIFHNRTAYETMNNILTNLNFHYPKSFSHCENKVVIRLKSNVQYQDILQFANNGCILQRNKKKRMQFITNSIITNWCKVEGEFREIT